MFRKQGGTAAKIPIERQSRHSKNRTWIRRAYYFKEALHLDPCFAEPPITWNIVLQTETLGTGAGTYEKSNSMQAGFLNAYFNRANTFYELKTYYRALGDLNHLIQEKPDTAIAYLPRGLVYTKLRDFPAALKSFDRAIHWMEARWNMS